MNLNNVEFTISAVRPNQYPTSGLPEIALAGRSNVGKSSFVNKMLGRKKIARTSSAPGKTATLNFYYIDNTFYFVDLPGYGYAAVSKQEQKRWAEMIETYLHSRKQLCATLLLVDARHKPTQMDAAMLGWIRRRHSSAVVFATKCDKLAKSKVDASLELIYNTLGLTDDDILIPFSAEKGIGRDEGWEVIQMLVEPQNAD